MLTLEQASHIDRTDFLNAVVREKGRFENALDDCVAAGLNGGTDVLMNQVCFSPPFSCRVIVLIGVLRSSTSSSRSPSRGSTTPLKAQLSNSDRLRDAQRRSSASRRIVGF